MPSSASSVCAASRCGMRPIPGTVANGSLVVALPRDRTLLDRFARMTRGYRAARRPRRSQSSNPLSAERFADRALLPGRSASRARRRTLASCSSRRKLLARSSSSAKAKPR